MEGSRWKCSIWPLGMDIRLAVASCRGWPIVLSGEWPIVFAKKEWLLLQQGEGTGCELQGTGSKKKKRKKKQQQGAAVCRWQGRQRRWQGGGRNARPDAGRKAACSTGCGPRQTKMKRGKEEDGMQVVQVQVGVRRLSERRRKEEGGGEDW
ncbi:hypothetical protein MRB53_016518 [Persea americana]|uniref:Uncharacterized protein n=1 Tax=Persea americana TaxID=3435 RepID=A0ACC2M3D0_PERAE|nr:hypothetical protein MRB53_016518 [Persea americana]